MWFFRFAIILLEFLFIFYYTAVVFQLLDVWKIEALSKLELPRVVMAGGNTSNGGTAMDAMGLKMVSDLVDKMSN